MDAYSKWAEVVEMPQTTAARTITALRHMFATHGIPDQLVSVHSLCQQNSEFTKLNRIEHTQSSPYHPVTNSKVCPNLAIKAGRGDGLTLAHQLEFPIGLPDSLTLNNRTPPCELEKELLGSTETRHW